MDIDTFIIVTLVSFVTSVVVNLIIYRKKY